MEYKIIPESLIPLEKEEPKVILETWEDYDVDRLRVYSFKAPSRLMAAVNAMAKMQGKTRSELIREILEKYVTGRLVEVEEP